MTAKSKAILKSAVQKAAEIQAERREAEKEAARQRESQFLELLQDLHAGKEISPEDVLARCEQCGATIERLQSNIDQLGELQDELDQLATRRGKVQDRLTLLDRQKEIETEIEALKTEQAEVETASARLATELHGLDELRHKLRRIAPSDVGAEVKRIDLQLSGNEPLSRDEVQALRDRQDELLQCVARVGVVVGA